MAEKTETLEMQVEGKKVRLTHLDKVLFPASGFRKADLIDYYAKVSRYILPHLIDRPLTLKMYATGVTGKAQYIKDALSFTPKWIKRAPVPRRGGGPDICYLRINDLPSLLWVSNMNNIELHVFQAKVPKIQKPTMMVFDLDPGEPATVLSAAKVALALKDALKAAGLDALVKASGGKGLHVCVPLNTAVTYDQTEPFARAVAEKLEQSYPELVVSQMSKSLRRGKVFIDWSQNIDYKTTVCVYSLRAKGDSPTVSFPLDWKELSKALEKSDLSYFFTSPEAALETLQKKGDLFAPMLDIKQKLPKKVPSKIIRADEPPALRLAAGNGKGKAPARLRPYQAKRDFAKTAEPAGSMKGVKSVKAERMFVIQKHAARNLHYDFRLEMEDVLRSWAVPKGPPTERGQSRLAMHVEDHPMDYARFEGIIPQGQYGGGTVMVWDIGTYTVPEGNATAAYYRGKLPLILNGKKLKGEWLLVRDRRQDAQEAKQKWLLIKTGSNARPISKKQDDTSVLSGRSMHQIAEQKSAAWKSSR